MLMANIARARSREKETLFFLYFLLCQVYNIYVVHIEHRSGVVVSARDFWAFHPRVTPQRREQQIYKFNAGFATQRQFAGSCIWPEEV